MEIEARGQADKKVEALESRLDNMQQLLENYFSSNKILPALQMDLTIPLMW
jgi:hypothetical protein